MLDFIIDHPLLGIVAIIASLFANLFIGSIIYGNFGNFLEALHYHFQPFWLSVLRDKGEEDMEYSFKNIVFYALAFVTTAAFIKGMMLLTGAGK
jgi:small-conductance mechanosensitive channel